LTFISPTVTHGQDTTTSQDDSDTFPDLHPAQPLPLLIRVTNGKSKKHRAEKVKLSTVVEPDALEAFYTRYAEVCKGGMAALKPRDRTKRKAKAKKKKVVA
jgi:signal recognition particle subunit SRP14